MARASSATARSSLSGGRGARHMITKASGSRPSPARMAVASSKALWLKVCRAADRRHPWRADRRGSGNTYGITQWPPQRAAPFAAPDRLTAAAQAEHRAQPHASGLQAVEHGLLEARRHGAVIQTGGQIRFTSRPQHGAELSFPPRASRLFRLLRPWPRAASPLIRIQRFQLAVLPEGEFMASSFNCSRQNVNMPRLPCTGPCPLPAEDRRIPER